MNVGYNFNDVNSAQQLMQARLGIFEKKPFQEQSIEGINEQALKLRVGGGNRQQERMIKDKRRSLDRAVHFSYQAAEIRNVESEENSQPIRALINPNKLKQDYDDKILSVRYDYGFKPGDVFEWLGTKTHWLIYLQDLTELAYFRGDIRKCNYQTRWRDENGELQTTWLAIRGPVETKINYIQKNGVSVDRPNLSLNILMPKTDAIIKRFTRYQKFYLRLADDLTNSVCWRVEAADALSMPGVLEINAVEYYANESEDDIENGLVDELLIIPTEPEDNQELIQGETFIRPKKSYEYLYIGTELGEWGISNKYPVEVEYADDTTIRLKWIATTSGQFELKYSTLDDSKTIIVESLF